MGLVVRNDGRDRYLDALELADRGDLRGLVTLFAGLQKDEFVKALSIARNVLHTVSAEHAVRAVRDQLQRRRDAVTPSLRSGTRPATSRTNFARQPSAG